MARPLRSETSRAIANLAIELGDPGRMAKARRLHRKGGVVGVEVAARTASMSIIEADDAFGVEIDLGDDAASGEVPRAEDLTTTCDCEEGGDPACRHVLAGLLGLAESFEANPRLLDTWTGSRREISDRAQASTQPSEFFGEQGLRRPIPKLRPRPQAEYPDLEVEGVAAGPVFEDATEAVRKTLSPYQARS